MRSGQAYVALAHALEDWRSRPSAALAAAVGKPPEVDELQIAGELVRVEISATWADVTSQAVLVEAVAYGPSTLFTERVSEKVRIELQQRGSASDA